MDLESISKTIIENPTTEIKVLEADLSSVLGKTIAKYPDMRINKIEIVFYLGQSKITEIDEVK